MLLFYLMFGRIPHLPVDVFFRTVLNDLTVVSYDRYVESFEKDLKVNSPGTCTERAAPSH